MDDLNDFIDSLDELDGEAKPKDNHSEEREKLKNLVSDYDANVKKTLSNLPQLEMFEQKTSSINLDNLNHSLKDLKIKEANLINSDIEEIYFYTFLKYQSNPSDLTLNLVLRYGLITERFIGNETLFKLIELYNPKEPDENILYFSNWLLKIYNGEEVPSKNELGISYDEAQKKKKKEAQIDELQIKNEKIKYEIEKIFSPSAKLMLIESSNGLKCFSAYQVGNLDNSMVTPEKIQDAIQNILKIDYGLFYREMFVSMDKKSNELVYRDIAPYFVILPIIGDKITFWQELSGAKKSTRGRIFLPAFFIGDFKTALIKALGNYRWELCRGIKNYLWMDPIDGGITGAFYNYITFFKKNTKISLEAKEKLLQIISTHRKDLRRIFIYFYHIWIEFESKGIMRLEKNVRDIFMRYMPFSLELCEKLKKFPAYEQLVTRHFNIRNRKLLSLKRIYKSRADENGNLPIEMKETLDYFSR